MSLLGILGGGLAVIAGFVPLGAVLGKLIVGELGLLDHLGGGEPRR